MAPAGRAGARSPGCRTCRCSRAPARTASWPACCSRAPTTRTAASSATKVLTPDTAHGTNPATVTMAGYEVVKVGTAEDGGVDLDDLRAKATDDVACLMLTNPNTLGLFDRNIEEIARIVHEVGATLYYDGANLNAVMGIARPGDMGFDIVHFNLHKTFTQPHGGGGPGAGPIAVLGPHRAVPARRRRWCAAAGDNGVGPASTSTTTGPSRSASCAASRATSACSCAPTPTSARSARDGLKDASQIAVLNANYLKARLAEEGIAEYLPIAFDRTCMHEFVLSGTRREGEAGHQDARHRQAHARPRGPPADRLLPAAGGRGADDRAHRDRDARSASTTSPTSCARSSRRPPRTRRSPATRPTPRRCAASTRPAPPSGRSSAGARTQRTRRPGARRRCRGRRTERCRWPPCRPAPPMWMRASAGRAAASPPQPRAPARGAAVRHHARRACTTC